MVASYYNTELELIELFRMTHSVTHVWRHRLNFIPLC